MTGKAHFAVGIAAATTIIRPETLPEALPVIAGASLGSLICDIDCRCPSGKSEKSQWHSISLIVSGTALLADHFLGQTIWCSLDERAPVVWAIGITAFVLSCTFASISRHRAFSHSLLALALETASLWLIFPTMAMPFAIAFFTHLLLDLTNKKSVRLLYPFGSGICLGWCYADRLADKLLALGGSIWAVTAALLLFINKS